MVENNHKLYIKNRSTTVECTIAHEFTGFFAREMRAENFNPTIP